MSIAEITNGSVGEPTLKSLPVQLLRDDEGIVLIRGAVEFKVSGPGAEEAVEVILRATAAEGATREEVRTLFAETDRPAVDRLIDLLLKRRVLDAEGLFAPPPPNGEDTLDVFYWHYGTSAKRVASVSAHKT